MMQRLFFAWRGPDPLGPPTLPTPLCETVCCRCMLAGRRDILATVLPQSEIDYLAPVYDYTRFKTAMPLEPLSRLAKL
jgi:hypothetical protein